ncbi:MAG: 1-phosphofructokinase [Chloroflexi bacterium]|nr:1-phosphofructokinase [Chloroflexota bacterium]
MIVTVTPNPALDLTLTVPRILLNDVLRATDSRVDWGGKGFNVSRALQALGIESLALGLLGGHTGRRLAEGLDAAGIETDFVWVGGETRTSIVVTTEGNDDEHLKVNEVGPVVRSDEVEALVERVRGRVQPDDVWVFSGSLPPGAPANLYARMIDLVQGQGATAVLDTSGEPLQLGCRAAPFLVKPNVVEVEQVTGRSLRSEADAQSAAQILSGWGINWVALSMGADGLLLSRVGEAVCASPPRVDVRNAVGAGDALVAGLVWGLLHSLSALDMARWAVATGTVAAVKEGVAFGNLIEVTEMCERISVRRVNGPGG